MVLIILATVSINTVLGEGGIIQKAEQAKQMQANATKAEEEAMDELVEDYEIAIGEKGPNGLTAVLKLTEIQTETTVSEDKNGVKVTVPAGFKVRADLGRTAAEGIVIEDEDGNQFVWVPCTTTGEEGKIAYEQDTQYNDGTTASKQVEYTAYTDWTDTGKTASVAEHGGFYVARYEAGVPEDADFYANTNGATYYRNDTTPSKNVTTYTPVSKAKNQSWNYISQTNAKTVSENMYAGNSAVTSQLIDSYAWDTIVNWMESEKTGIATSSTSYGNYSSSNFTVGDTLYAEHIYNAAKTGSGASSYGDVATTYKKGRVTTGQVSLGSEGDYNKYKRKELATGASDATKVKNIYDMAGNMWEWTTETGYHNAGSGTQYAVRRGGGFESVGGDRPLSTRRGDKDTSYTNSHIGFRVVLYVNV